MEELNQIKVTLEDLDPAQRSAEAIKHLNEKPVRGFAIFALRELEDDDKLECVGFIHKLKLPELVDMIHKIPALSQAARMAVLEEILGTDEAPDEVDLAEMLKRAQLLGPKGK